jgi:NAD(P)-dependent dehydrogenase (short-subunit alcohol dehydrogenase family)
VSSEGPGGAIVVGAAGGIGTEVVGEFLRRGFTVLGIDREPPTHTEDPPRYRHVRLDWSDSAGADRVHDQAAEMGVRHIVTVAGGALAAEVDHVDAETFALGVLDPTMTHNLGTALTSISLAQRLAGTSPDRQLSVILCSSINAIGGYDYPLYSAAKGALETLVRSMAVPLGRRRVRVNCVRLGTVVTETSARLHGEGNDDHYEPLLELTALRRFVTAQEAALAMVVSSVDLTGMTGEVITVDAGQSIPGPRPDGTVSS